MEKYAFLNNFYQRDAMLARVYATAFPSVCLCVCRSVCHTRACIKTAKSFVEVLLPPDSPIILVFRHRGSLLNSDGATLKSGTKATDKF